MSTDVFISYSTRDAAVAKKICAAIESRGVRCWIAPRDVRPGEDWPQAIMNAINGSPIMVVVFSSASNEAPQVQREVERAGNRRDMTIIPVRVENILPSGHMEFFLSRQHWLDAFESPVEPQLALLAQTVVETLAHKRGKPVPPPPTPTPPPKPAAKPLEHTQLGPGMTPWIVGAITAALVLVLTFGYLAYRHANQSPPVPPPNPLQKLIDFVEAEDWPGARKEANSFLADPSITKNQEYKRLVRKIDDAEQADLSQRVTKQLTEIETAAQSLGAGLSLENNVSKARDLRTRLQNLNADELKRAGASTSDRAKRLDATLSSRLNAWTKKSEFESELKDFAPTGGVKNLENAIRKLRERHPEMASDPRLAFIDEESSYWQGVDAWSEYFRRPAFNDRDLTPQSAGELKQKADALSEQYPNITFKDEYNNGRADHIIAVSRRIVGFDGRDRVKSLVDAWKSKANYMSGIYVMHVSNVKNPKSVDYYTSIDPSTFLRPGITTSFEYISDSTGHTTKQALQRNDNVTFSAAPHCELIAQLTNQFQNVERIRTKEWVPAFSKALQTVRDAQEIDPILHHQIFKQVFENGAAGSLAIQNSYAFIGSALAEAKVTNPKWFLPNNHKFGDSDKVQGEREQAQSALSRIPKDLSTAASEASKLEERLFSVKPFSFAYAGWLEEANGDWHIADKDPTLTAGSLYVVTRSANSPGLKSAEMTEVGELQGGMPVWLPRAKALLHQWRPLFIKK